MIAFYLRLSPANRGMTMVLWIVILFTVMDALTKYLTRFYPVNLVLCARFFFHTLLFVAFLGPRIGTALYKTRRPGWQLVRGLFLACAAFCFVTSIKYMPMAEVTAIAYVNPLLISLLAVVLLGERMERGRWVAIFVAFAGVLCVIRPGTSMFQWVALLPLLNAVFYAFYQIMTRYLSDKENQYPLIFYPGLIGFVIYAFLSAPTAVMLAPFHLLLVAMAGILSGSAHLAMIRALKLATASHLAPFSYTQLIWVMLIGYVFFGDFPDAWSLFGIALLVGSGLYCANHQRLLDKRARMVSMQTLPSD